MTDDATRTALSTEVNSFGWNIWLETAGCLVEMVSCLPCGRPMTVQERRQMMFAATNRISPEPSNSSFDCDLPHEVLELVLSQNHCVVSKNMAIVVEMPDQKQLIQGRPPLSRSNKRGFRASLQDLVNVLSLNSPDIRPEERDRWEQAEQHTFELVVHSQSVGPIRSERICNQVSVFVRRASLEEVAPHPVDFHLSQKAWHERMLIWMTASAHNCQQGAARVHHRAATIPRCHDFDDTMVYTLSRTDSMDSMVETSNNYKRIPDEIAVKREPQEQDHYLNSINTVSHNNKNKEKKQKLDPPAPHKNVWISDFDVVLGVNNTATTTIATEVFEERVLPIYSSKTDLREGHIKIMKLMLQEELRDDGDKNIPASTFWMKASDVEEEEEPRSNRSDTKWLRLESGDFLGPFVEAHDRALQQAVTTWISHNRDSGESRSIGGGGQRDPEPSFKAIETAPTDEQEDPIEDIRQAMSKDVVKISPVKAVVERPPLFNLDGPIETMSDEARKLCQDWVNNSKTLLIKVAKKTMIDAFQTDFRSFLFLFQVQLKRIKGGDLSRDGSSVAGADDSSWVSAEPSVEEEDTRVEDIEEACIAFMNQMGNNMVLQYERLSGDYSVNAPPAPVALPEATDRQEDQQEDAEATSETASSTSSSNGNENELSGEDRQSSPTCVTLVREETQQSSKKESYYHEGDAAIRNLASAPKEEGPEESVVENSKSVSFDLHDSGSKIQQAVMRQLETKVDPVRPTQASSTRRYHRDNFPYDHDEEDSTQSHTSYDDRSFDSPSYDPSLETLESRNDDRYYDSPRSRSRSRSRSRTLSTEYGIDDDTLPTVDSGRDGSDESDDDDTFPTVGSGRYDSLTHSPSDLSFEECAENPKKRAGCSLTDSWIPAWLS